MLLDVIVQVIEGLDLLQLVDGDSNLVGCLHNGNEVYNTYTIQAESLFEARIGRELTLLYFKLFFKQAVYLINDFLSCHNFIVFFFKRHTCGRGFAHRRRVLSSINICERVICCGMLRAA